MAQAASHVRAPFAVDLTIPGDQRFVDTVRALAVRVAEYAGYAPKEAEAIGGAVGRATALLVARAGAACNGAMEIHFSTEGDLLAVELRYPGDPAAAQELVAEVGGPLTPVREVLPLVELGVDRVAREAVTVCRLMRPLPEPSAADPPTPRSP